jgi:hypothetical protein
MNWYTETLEIQDGKGQVALYPTPGSKTFATLDAGPVLQLWASNVTGRLFAITASHFWEITSSGGSTILFTWPNPPIQEASICEGHYQIFITAGGRAYAFTQSTNTMKDVTSSLANPVGSTGPQFCGFSDGYFIVTFGGTNEFQISQLEDATSWNGTDVAQVSVWVGNIVGMIVDHREIWFFGTKAAQSYYNSGAAAFPWAPVPGAYVELGLAASHAVAKLDNSVFWLDADERGAGVARRAQGYTPSRISDHAVEYRWSKYSTISDAISYAYQDQGHAFWVLYFPTGNETWVFDAAESRWHQRSYLNRGVPEAHHSRCHAWAFGTHLVGDWASGQVFAMSIGTFTDQDPTGTTTTPISRVRRAPVVSQEMQWLIMHLLQVDLEVATTAISQPAQGWDPYVSVRWSDDGTKTWSNLHTASAGRMGEYKKRVILRRLGRSRNRVYEISVTDPIAWRIADAYVMADPGYALGTKRLVKAMGEVA